MTKVLQKIKVARVATVSFFILTQLRDQIEAIKEAGATVSVVAGEDGLSKNFNFTEGCEFIPLYIPREINIRQDLIALYQLWKLFRTQRFDIVHSISPKAGLLCAIAGRLARVPVRLHTYTGQIWVTLNGVKKSIVKYCDKIIAALNTQCYTDSLSQQEFLIQQHVIARSKLFVLGKGSLAGVNIQRFSKSRFSLETIKDIKHSLGIIDDPLIVLFVGRITKDKGIFELIEAFQQIIKHRSDVVLVLTGPLESGLDHSFQEEVQKKCFNKVIFTGFFAEPERFMAIADILCLPSYREGFGTVVIEAALMGLPVVGTNIYGLTDAIVDNVTGILVEPKNSVELAQALEKLLSDSQLRTEMGSAAQKRALQDFDSRVCNELLIQEYQKLLMAIKQSRVLGTV